MTIKHAGDAHWTTQNEIDFVNKLGSHAPYQVVKLTREELLARYLRAVRVRTWDARVDGKKVIAHTEALLNEN